MGSIFYRWIIILIYLINMNFINAQSSKDHSWYIANNSSYEIIRDIPKNSSPFYDKIEMSGLQVSCVIRYGVNQDGSFYLNRGMVWPLLRTIPNNTHASLMRRFGELVIPKILINHRSLEGEQVEQIRINGKLEVFSTFQGGITLKRKLFPSPTQPVFCEHYTLINKNSQKVKYEIPNEELVYMTSSDEGVEGSYKLIITLTGKSGILQPGDSISFSITIGGYSYKSPIVKIEVNQECQQRELFLHEMASNLILETPDTVLNQLFYFSKIRGTESIFQTKGGLMHGPGGESYYAAIWANDQAEYANPFFPFLGDKNGNESAFNSFRHFAKFINPNYQPIPSSIIAEGDDIWNGAGDRGDAAMIAYGASRFALASGDRKQSEELWLLIEWCLEYCRLHLNQNGVVTSNTDELEGRFPAGEANLCTSSLYYDALISAYYLGKELNKPQNLTKLYWSQAQQIRKNIEFYFGATVEGFETYRYYDGNEKLRSWICIPLTMGIDDRKEGTIRALLSPQLWSENGILTETGSSTYWDRSTLYAFRGMLIVGEIEKVLPNLIQYSQMRLLGEHVPYPIEAWPEGDQRHLSAESTLYCRIFTEGLFGIRVTGFNNFKLSPQLPAKWDKMALRAIRLFGKKFDIEIIGDGDFIQIIIMENQQIVINKRIKKGTSINVKI